MKISIKRLTLLNFKGIRNLNVDFSDVTDISGRNGSGKSTIFDAFTWLLFGKNSQDKKDFEIKTLDENNNPIHKIDHEVTGLLDVDGVEINIKRVFREKWVKPKGQPEPVFQGHETEFFWNDVPVSQADFKEKVESLCDEGLFKLITNPTAFNDLHWTKQRELLFQMAGDVTDTDVAGTNAEFKALLDRITGKDFQEFKREIAAKKKKLNDELKAIPTRIDEITRNMPEPVDASAINKLVGQLEEEINVIESEMLDRSKAAESQLQKREDIQKEIYKLRNLVSDLEFQDRQVNTKAYNEHQSSLNLIKEDVAKKQEAHASKQREIKSNTEKIVSLVSELDHLKKQWVALNEEKLEFKNDQFSCPTCKRAYEAEDIEAKKSEMTTNFNTDKVKRLEEITKSGQAKKAEQEALKARNEEIQKEIDVIIKDLSDINELLLSQEKEPVQSVSNPHIPELHKKIGELEESLRNQPGVDNSEQMKRKADIQHRISNLKTELQANEFIEKNKARIQELEGQSKTLGQEVADLERLEFTMAEFTKCKIEMVEGRINSKFPTVRFKMYQNLINGGEEETCVALVNGVPFNDVNTAGQINAGLEIIGALCEHYGVLAPIFVDQSESVNQLFPTESQLVRLVVTTDEKLTVSHSEKFERVEV